MKSIRFYITLSIMFISMIFLTGCKFNVDTQENLSKKPIYNDNEKILEEGISSYLSIKENFILPVNIGDVGKINTVNLDTNKENEIVAFKKSTNVDDDKENQVGFILLKKSANSDNYSFEDEVLVEGDSIEYANFVDLNGDGFKEIILLAKTKNYTKLYMFNYKDKIEELNFSEPNWVKENNLNDLKIAIGNVDSDEKIDIVMMYFNAENSKAFISVADFTDTLNYKEPKQIDYVKNLVDSFITIGNISSSYIKRGFIVDTPSLQDGYYVTNVFYLKDGVLQSKNFDLSITKPSYMPVIDIDFDGVLEIPYYSMTYRASNDGNVDWYKFNTLNNSFKFWKQIYYNYNYNFKVQIADKLKGKIFVENDNENLSKQNSCQFNFYYYDDEFDYRKNLFSIIIENTKLEAENKTVVSNKIKLCDYENYSYYYKINDYDELKKLKLTQENIKDSFSIIFE